MDAAIDGWIAEHRDEAVELAREFVRIPSENRPPEGDELAVQRFLESQLRELGADVDVFSPEDVPELHGHPAYFPTVNGAPRDLTGRPDVVGTFRGSGGGRSVLFSTHVDTVPGGDANDWTTGSPFGGEIVDGRLYGRGSYDTKCALASHLTAIRCLRELGIDLTGDVLIEGVVDEEYGGSHGVLAARLRGHNADLAFNSEPTHLKVCPSHRGGREAYLRLQGDAGMAFGGEQLNDPVIGLARAIVGIRAFDEERNRDAPPPLYGGMGDLPFYLNQIGGGGTTYREAVGTPDSTYLHFWAETYEDTTGEAFDAALLARVEEELSAHPDTADQTPMLDRTIRFLPGSSMPLDHPGLGVLEEAFGDTPFELQGAPFACDAYVFNLHSPTPAVILGPGGRGAHAPDEHVLVDDLIELARISARFIARWST